MNHKSIDFVRGLVLGPLTGEGGAPISPVDFKKCQYCMSLSLIMPMSHVEFDK